MMNGLGTSTTYESGISNVGQSAAPVEPTSYRHNHRSFTLARYAIDAPVLPLVTDTLPLAEQVRFALMSQYEKVRLRQKYGRDVPEGHERFSSPVFSGKDGAGRPLVGHRHAFFLPADEDGDGRIDHITVFVRPGVGRFASAKFSDVGQDSDPAIPTRQNWNLAPQKTGFDREELQALDRLRRLRFGAGAPLRLLLVGLHTLPALLGGEGGGPLIGPAADWITATPFVVTRYPKKRGRKRDSPELLGRDNTGAFVATVLREQFERLRQIRPDLPIPNDIQPLPGRRLPPGLLPIQFKRFRRKPGDDGGRRPSGAFRITFSEPVTGPLCLGHSSHFGLGLFVPDGEAAHGVSGVQT